MILHFLSTTITSSFSIATTLIIFFTLPNTNILNYNKSSQLCNSSKYHLGSNEDLDSLFIVYSSFKTWTPFLFRVSTSANFIFNLHMSASWRSWSLLHLTNTIRIQLLCQIGCLCLPQFYSIFAIVNYIFCPIKVIAIHPTYHILCKTFIDLTINHFVFPCHPSIQFKNVLHHWSKKFRVVSIPI